MKPLYIQSHSFVYVSKDVRPRSKAKFQSHSDNTKDKNICIVHCYFFFQKFISVKSSPRRAQSGHLGGSLHSVQFMILVCKRTASSRCNYLCTTGHQLSLQGEARSLTREIRLRTVLHCYQCPGSLLACTLPMNPEL